MAAVTAQSSLPTAAELVRSRYTPSSPHFTLSTEPQVKQLFRNELRQGPGRKTAYNEQASLKAKYSSTIKHPNSRYSPEPASQSDFSHRPQLLSLAAHKALAARLAGAAARQQRQQQQRRNDNVWTTRLAADVSAVCSELGLPAAVARALAAAAMQGKISANPGVLLSLLCRIMPLQQHLAGPSNLSDLLANLPTVILHDPKTLISNLAAVQQILGSPAAAVAAVKQYPQLIVSSPFRLQTNLNRLQDLLGFSSPSAAAAACARQPLLLLTAADTLQQRWQQLHYMMAAVGVEELNRQLRRSPELLLLKTSTVAAKMHCLNQLFRGYQHVPPPPAAAAARRSKKTATAAAAAAVVEDDDETGYLLWDVQEQLPELDAKQQQEVAQKLAQIKAATAALRQRQRQQQQQQPKHGQTQELRNAHLKQFSSGSSSSSSSSDPRVQRLVLKLPALLSLNPDTLHHHVTELQLLLGLQPDDGQLQRIVLLQPGLLTQSPATLANKLQLLQFVTGRSEAMVQEMVLKCPAILTLSVSNVTNKWNALQKCVSVCPEWQQQLKDAANVTLAVTLCYSAQRLQRLKFVAEMHNAQSHGSSSSSSSSFAACIAGEVRNAAGQTQQQQRQQQQGLAAVPWRTLIQQSDAAFCQRYPGYQAWQQQQQQQQGWQQWYKAMHGHYHETITK